MAGSTEVHKNDEKEKEIAMLKQKRLRSEV